MKLDFSMKETNYQTVSEKLHFEELLFFNESYL